MRYALNKVCNLGLILSFGMLLILAAPQAAMAQSGSQGPSEELYVSLVTPVQKAHNVVWKVQWSDGEKQTLWPCKYEDSRHCYWDAGQFGNKIGNSFVMTRNHVWYLNDYAL